MTLPNEYKPPNPTAGDHLHALARAGVGSIPFVGAAAKELLSLLITPPLEKRRREWMESIGEALRGLEQDERVRLKDLQSNDAFVDTVMHALQAALRNSEQEKIVALRNAVLNATLPNAPEESLQHIFLNLVDTMTVWHLQILRLFHEPRSWFVENGGRVPEIGGGQLGRVLEAAYPKMAAQRTLYDHIVKDLNARGLLSVDSLHGPNMSAGGLMESRSTALGKLFLAFITCTTVNAKQKGTAGEGVK